MGRCEPGRKPGFVVSGAEMPTWVHWVLFLVVGAIAVVLAKWLDDAEGRRYPGAARPSSLPPEAPGAPREPAAGPRTGPGSESAADRT